LRSLQQDDQPGEEGNVLLFNVDYTTENQETGDRRQDTAPSAQASALSKGRHNNGLPLKQSALLRKAQIL
jgi:hypothetical protein